MVRNKGITGKRETVIFQPRGEESDIATREREYRDGMRERERERERESIDSLQFRRDRIFFFFSSLFFSFLLFLLPSLLSFCERHRHSSRESSVILQHGDRNEAVRLLAEGEGERTLINHRKGKRNFIQTMW